jgi:hypothetical protein
MATGLPAACVDSTGWDGTESEPPEFVITINRRQRSSFF